MYFADDTPEDIPTPPDRQPPAPVEEPPDTPPKGAPVREPGPTPPKRL